MASLRPRQLLALGASALLASTLTVLAQVPTPARAASCETSTPASGAYTVTVCLAEPADGAVLSGTPDVTASATVSGASPGVQRVTFYLDGSHLLTDVSAPYTFSLPTQKDADGVRLLEAAPVMRDGFLPARAAVRVTFLNGNAAPPVNTNRFTPRTGTSPPAGRPFVLAAAGDGAGGLTIADQVTDRVASWNPNMFLYLGDVYEKGTPAEFHNWYGTQSTFFGRFRSITNPAIGNHEYEGSEAPGYFDYWDNVPHYYSVDAAGWHFISLDSTSQYGQLEPGTDQYEWLKQDLASNRNNCTIAFFHHPRFNVGPEGGAERLSAVWSLLAEHGVEVALAGHDHDYQRWTALDGSGRPDPNGVTQFVVGTGGHGIQNLIATDSRMVKGFDSSPDAYGALRMELNPLGASYQFINTKGTVLDSGSIPCTGSGPDTQAPNPPTELDAASVGSHQVDLGWTSATDNVGVTGHRIYRNGSPIATTGPATTFSDLTVSAEVTYRYEVRALDAAGNESAPSNPVAVTTRPGQAGLFADDFETGNLSRWTSVSGLGVQQADVFSGSWAARGTSTGAATWGYKQLSESQTELYYRIRFKMAAPPAGSVYLLKFRTATGSSLLGLYVTSTGKLSIRNDVAGVSISSTTTVSTGAWHDVQVRVRVDGASSQTETWFDGARVDALSRSDSLGTTPIGRIQLGENSTGRTYDVAFDTVLVDTSFIVTDTEAPSVPVRVSATASGAASVDVAWSAATDNVGVTGYSIYRDGVFLAGVAGGSLTFTDDTAEPSTTYRYTLDAFDAAGNHSAQSSEAAVTTSPDTTPPSAPSSVTITGRGATEIDIAWTAARDDVGVARYDVYRDHTKVAEVDGATLSYADGDLLPSTTYSYTVEALDAAGNRSARAPAASGTTRADTSPPSAPTALRATAVSPEQIDLSWSASRDDVRVDGYEIYRDGTKVGSVDGEASRYSDAGRSPGRTYTYTVRALDAAGNVSADSEPATATTPDVAPPSAPTGLTATPVSFEQIDLSWNASTDDAGVARYDVYRDGAKVGSVGGTTLSYSDTGLEAQTSYTYSVQALDAAGNRSAHSEPASARTDTAPERTPPLPPALLTATVVSPTRVDLQWTASTDNVGVTGYRLYRCVPAGLPQACQGTRIGEVAASSLRFSDTAARPSTTYRYTVDAVDAAGNASAQSAPDDATTPADTTPPTAPVGLTASAVGSSRIDLSWAAATDDDSIARYEIYRCESAPCDSADRYANVGRVGGSNHSYSDTDLSSATTYHYTVQAVDPSGNVSDRAEPASATTPDTTPPAAPTGLSAAAVGPTRVDLAWDAATDNVAVTGYWIYRGGTKVGSVGGTTLNYSDTAAAPSTTYSYTVKALDAAGNLSASSSPASATTPAAPALFSDDFETGSLSRWTTVSGLVVQQAERYSGGWAARATTTDAASYASRALGASESELYYRVRFKVVSQGPNSVYLLKFRTGGGSSILGLFISETGKLAIRNDAGAVTTTSSTTVTKGVWHQVQVRVVISGSSSRADVWYDGVQVAALSKAQNLGTTGVGRLQLAENSPAKSYDVAFDEVAVSRTFVQ